MTRDEAKQFFKDTNVRYVLAQFVDIHGAAKAKAVPVSHFDEVLDTGAGFAGFAVWGLGIQPHGPDFMARGDLGAVSLVPWQPGFARIVCDGHVHGKPWEYDSRVVLKKQVALLKEQGLTFFTGLEPEFSVLRRDAQGNIVPCDASDTLQKPCYDYKALSRTREYMDRLVTAAIGSGLDVYQIDHEDGNGQFEINYTYGDCLTSADQFIGFKMAAAEIANDMGLICSFMPKPFSNRPGNGMHMHMSMGDGKRNLFEDKTDKRGLDLSTMAYHFLGGVLKHAKALTAICCPTVNSYKRLVVGRSLTGATWAPAYVSYGNNNRSCMVRIPGGRLELRVPDGGCRTAQPWHRDAAAKPQRSHRRVGSRPRDHGRAGPGGTDFCGPQAHGVGGIHAPRLRLGNQNLPRIFLRPFKPFSPSFAKDRPCAELLDY